jgi:subtilisin family serine protease
MNTSSRFAILAALALLLAACAAPPPPTPTPDELAISLSTNRVTALQGKTSEIVTVTLERPAGFTASVSLTVLDKPGGVAEIVSDPGTGNQGSLQLAVSSTVPPGSYDLTVEARGGNQVATAPLELVVVEEGEPGEPGSATLRGTLRTANFLDAFEVPDGLGAQGFVPQSSPEARPAYVPGQLIVQLRPQLAVMSNEAPSYSEVAVALVQEFGLSVLRQGSFDTPALVALPDGQDVETVAVRLAQDPRVAYAEPNRYIYVQSLPNDPLLDQLWHLPASGVPVAWHERDSATSVTVAVVDTGIDIDHEDFQGVFVGGYDFCASQNCGSRNNNPRPDSASDVHGTHVAGIVAAVGNNGRGVAGVLAGGARVVPIKAFHQGVTTVFALSEAVRWAAGLSVPDMKDNNPYPANIINLSLGTTADSDAFRNAIQAAQQAGALIIASAGNSGADAALYPARYSGVVGVGSVNSDFQRSCFSNFGDGLDIMAPGGDGHPSLRECRNTPSETILSTYPFDNNYGMMAGTSQAAPIVTGIAALLWAQQSNPSASSVRSALLASAYFDPSYMSSSHYGAGVARADDALGLLGPAGGRNVTASVIAESPGDSGIATATLDLLLGESNPFTIGNLDPGNYTVEADASRGGASLSGTTNVALSENQTREVTLELQP